MSRADRRTEQAHARLTERLARLSEVGDLVAGATGRLPDPLTERLAATLDHARTRLGHGAAHTVVALAGATGSGKSSVFNALVGSDVAAVGVRRPTTSATQAGVFAATGEVDDDVSALLGWLEVDRRHVVGGPGAGELDGLVLLDLPDHDSTAADHRAEVDRLVGVVDAFVWVVDPQKYADAALHDGYLRRFSTHAAVTIVVLNQVDLLPADQRRAVVGDLGRLLGEDGLGDVRILTTSARTGEGVDELRRELGARVAERRALVARLDADVDRLGDELAREVGDRPPGPVPDAARRRLGAAFAGAAGADAVADAVGHAHRRRAAQAVGWPPTRWIGRFRPDPLRRLGLDRPPPADGTETVGRTSRAGPSAVSKAAATTATRHLVEEVTTGLPASWNRRVGSVAVARRDDVGDALDRAVGSATLPTGRPRWWAGVSAIQWLLAGLMVVGLAWLVAIGVVAWLRLPDLPTPEIGALPWPTALALGGALAGLVVSVVARAAAGVGARRRTAAARRTLVRAAAATADELVVDPVDTELRALADLHAQVRALRS